MTAIASIPVTNGVFSAAISVLSADDTITFNPNKKQLLVFRNTTAGSLTAVLDGSTGTTVNVSGIGVVDVSTGLSIVLAAGVSKAVVLSSVSAYCSGVVHITGAAACTVQLFDL